jgi:hypothetical protein
MPASIGRVAAHEQDMMWLAQFPATNALTLSGIGLAWTTFVAAILGWTIPDGWLLFVAGFASVGAAQFTSKRLTWKPESPQNGAAPGA